MTTPTSDCSLSPADALPHAASSAPSRFPMSGLLALAAAGFITVLTEALPAGLLPLMGASLSVSESLVGQLVTVYAIGSLLAAVPLTTATQGLRRRPLLLTAIAGFALVNTVTALSTSYVLTLMARFLAGVFAGLLWALLAGYAARMVAPHQQGRAIAVAMVGAPLALSLGIPAGTFLGAAVGWRYTFGIMSLLTVVLVGWVLACVPDFPGQAAARRASLRQVLAVGGVRPVLFVTLAFVLAHNILYTYIAPFLAHAGMTTQIDTVLFVFGIASVAGIWIVGILIDRRLRSLVLLSTAMFFAAAAVLGLWSETSAVIYAAVAVWGLAFGGAGTLFQTALARTAGEAADVAQSLLVTSWNIAIAGGGIVGGILLDTAGVASVPWALLPLLAATLVVAARARRHGFAPAGRP